MNKIKKGSLLIAEPFLKDPDFQRSVVLICEHQQEGTFGITINKPIDIAIAELIEGLEAYKNPIFSGGPVNREHIHFLHIFPHLIPGGELINDNIYWGGDFEVATQLIQNHEIDSNGIKFFVGYSGWGEGQLKKEMHEKSWLITSATKDIVFHTTPRKIWENAVKKLDDDLHPIINYPLDPSFN
jgi:putative transcriptional regulator